MEMFKHNVCVQDARTAQAMLPPFHRSCNITEIGQLFGPIQLLRVAKERRQSRWLSFYLSAAASIQKLRGVPCMTRVLHHSLPLRRSYHHHHHHTTNTACVKSEASKQPQNACRRTLRGYLKCPRMLITNRNRTRHKKQVYQIVTEKPNNMNSAADLALHMVLKKKKCKEIVKKAP